MPRNNGGSASGGVSAAIAAWFYCTPGVYTHTYYIYNGKFLCHIKSSFFSESVLKCFKWIIFNSHLTVFDSMDLKGKLKPEPPQQMMRKSMVSG